MWWFIGWANWSVFLIHYICFYSDLIPKKWPVVAVRLNLLFSIFCGWWWGHLGGRWSTLWPDCLGLWYKRGRQRRNRRLQKEVCRCPLPQSCLTLDYPMDCSVPGSSVQEFSRQEYWSRLPFPLPGDPPNPGIEPKSLTSSTLSGVFLIITSTTWEVPRKSLVALKEETHTL